MDRDGSGTIDRVEWIHFLASPDPTVNNLHNIKRLEMKFLISTLKRLLILMIMTKVEGKTII